MSGTGASGEESGTQADGFAPTLWSVVLAAGQQEDSTRARQALEQLCRTYWYPLYGYLRRRRFTEHDAQDLTQGFFTLLIKRRVLEKVVPGKGKFRSYLLTALKHFLIDEHDREQAQKRGGDLLEISLDAQEAEQRYRLEPPDGETPEKLFERSWALAVIDGAMNRLQQEFANNGDGVLFEHLRGFIVEGAKNGQYRKVAERIGMSEQAVGKAVQRLRRRFGNAVREEIAKTVTTKSEIDEELRHLIAVLSS